MIYVFRCEGCGEEAEYSAPMAMLDALKQGAHCVDCQQSAVLVISGGRQPIMRSPFPKGFHEHISENGAYIRDKHEAHDVAEENGFTSKYVENDM